MINQDNGGAGVFNGGDYAITLFLTEGSVPDTDATPQVTYDPPSPAVDYVDDATAVQSVVAATATEVDRARPVLMSVSTADATVNGKTDGLALVFSEPVDGVTVNPVKDATGNPGTYSLSFKKQNQ